MAIIALIRDMIFIIVICTHIDNIYIYVCVRLHIHTYIIDKYIDICIYACDE